MPSSRQRTRSPVRYSRDPGLVRERIGDELLGRQLRAIVGSRARARRRRCRARRARRSGPAAAARRGRRTSCWQSGPPIGGEPSPGSSSRIEDQTVVSVGPYMLPQRPRSASAAPRPARAAAPRRRQTIFSAALPVPAGVDQQLPASSASPAIERSRRCAPASRRARRRRASRRAGRARGARRPSASGRSPARRGRTACVVDADEHVVRGVVPGRSRM